MPHTVLSVDTDAAVLRARDVVLRQAGFEVIQAATAEDALRLASELQPALILLAIDLPGTDGFAVSKRLKSDPRTAPIPVLLISRPGASQQDYPQSLESGAAAWLQDPVDPRLLAGVASALIRSAATANQAGLDAARKLSALIDAIPDEVWFNDAQGRLTLANPPALPQSAAGAPDSVSVEDLAGSPRPLDEAPSLRALRGETVRNQEEIVRTPLHGELRYREVSASPVKDATGNIVGSVSVVRDITRRKQAELGLLASQERFRSLFETMTEGFALDEIICDDQGKPCNLRYLAVNPAFERQTGLKAADILGRTLLDLFPAAEPMWIERYGNVALTGEPARLEGLFGPLGRWFQVSVFPAGPGRFAVIFTDITERKRAEEERQRLASELADRVGELQAILDAAPVVIWIAHDPQCRRITGNAYADRVVMQTGRGGNVSRSAPPGDQSVSYRVFRRGVEASPEELPNQVAAATGQPVQNDEWDLVFPDGRTVHLLLSAVPLFDAQGRVRGSVTAGVDVTRRKLAEKALEAHRQLMEAVVNHLPVGVAFLRGSDLTFQLLNPAYRALAPGKEMLGKPLQEVWPETQPLFAERCRQVLETGTPFHAVDEPFMVSRSTGAALESSFFSWSIDRVTLPGEDGWGLLLAVSETTGRKRAEEALRESEAVLRGFFDSPGMMRGFVDLIDGRIVHVSCNAAAAELFGMDRQSIAGKSAAEAGAPEQVARLWVDLYEKSRLTGKPVSMEYARRDPGGHERWLLATASHLGTGSSGNPRFAYTILDLTDRKRAEEALRASEKIYRAIGESIDYGVWVCAPDGRNTYASESFLRQVGLTQEQCSNFGWGDVLHPDDAERTVAAWKECVRTEAAWDMEHRFRGVDGQWHPILARGVPVRDERGQVACWVGINLDIGGLKRTEESLRASESRERARAAELEALMDAAPAGIFVARDVACTQMTGNPAAYDLLRRPSGSNLSKSASETEKPVNFRALNGGIEIPSSELPMQKAASTGQPVRKFEMDFVFEDGAVTNVLGDAVPLLDEGGNPRGAVGVFLDVTELKRAETRLREAQKLESIGLLAGGVAHDFNNLLVGVIGNASLAKELLPPDNPAADLLDGVIRTGEQAAHLTRQMLAYSGKGKFVVEALHLSHLIPDMAALLRPSIPKKIELHLDLEETLPPVEADRGQLQQVFMNLVLNAAEAIGSHDGLISVRTGVQIVDQAYLRRYPEAAALQEAKYVFLEVRDTGSGMDDATRARIFEPFFSTKFTGRGLGLAAVAGIVRGHKGAIIVSSAPGKGSCFTVLFPASERPAGQPPVAAPAATLQGAGTILVVDDEPIVREMAKRALERRGYTVLLADSGREALDVFRTHPADIALVVLDLSMPHMSGEEALPELRKIRPGIQVVVSSGYSEAEAMTLFRGQRVSGFIQKPYTAQKLAERVKSCLG